MVVKDMATNSVGDGLVWLLAALGVTFSAHEYVGGLFFALAFAMLARHWWPEKDRREIWITLLAAFLVATAGAEIAAWYFDGDIHVQLIMAGLGLASRVIATMVMKVLRRVEDRSDEIADKVIDKGLK